jgi:hypothetical protein
MNTPDMHNLFLLSDVDTNLFTDAKCFDLLDRYYIRMQAIKRQYPKGTQHPKEIHGELRYMRDMTRELRCEMKNRHSRLN